MLCPRCGSPMDTEDECTVCGWKSDNSRSDAPAADADIGHYGPDPDYDAPGSGDRLSWKTIVVFLAVFAVIAAAMFVWAFNDEGSYQEDSREVGRITLYGGMVSDDISVTDPSNGVVTYTGSGGNVHWEVKVLSATYLVETERGYYEERGYQTVQGESLKLSGPGNYKVRLYADGEQRSSGRIVLDGTVSQSFEWQQSVDGATYTYAVSYSYAFSDYYRYASDEDAIREDILFHEANRFVVVDSAILGLEDALSAEYLKVRGSSASQAGHEYADYLLSFVQCAIPYPDTVSWKDGRWCYDEDGNGDMYINGQMEYWSYPMETLYLGTGDCEDTSFLACALFSAAGYTSGVAVLEKHVMAAVQLDSIASNPSPERYVSYEFVLRSGGVLYYCETTYDEAVPAGYFSFEDEVEIAALTKLSMVYPYRPVRA